MNNTYLKDLDTELRNLTRERRQAIAKGQSVQDLNIEITNIRRMIHEALVPQAAEEKLCYYCEARSQRIARKVICRHGNK